MAATETMTVLAFEPHHDDCALFAAFAAQRLNATVVTVLQSHLQEARGYGITQQQRHAENAEAMRELGLEWVEWPYRDDNPDWEAVLVAMRAIDDRLEPSTVLAPAVEEGGHEQHSMVGRLAAEVFGRRVVAYLTYRRGYARSVGQVSEFTTDQVCRKLRALACYRSQIGEPTCWPWFFEGLTEYLA